MAKDTDDYADKKALRDEMIYQLNQSLGKLKDFLGEKKFNSRVKKAVKLLTEGIDKKKMKKEAAENTPVVAETKSAPKATKAVAPRKKNAAPKKTAKKTVAAPVQTQKSKA